MNQPYYPDLAFTLAELLDNGVMDHAELVTELSAAASGEAQLKETLASISKVRWEAPGRYFHLRDLGKRVNVSY